MSPDFTLLFVYGTLKRGFSRAAALTQQQFVTVARTTPAYRLYDCGSYPGLVMSQPDGLAIEGEIWQVDSRCLAELDEIEGVSFNLYRRDRVQIQPPLDRSEVQTYFYQRSVVGLADCGTVWPPKSSGSRVEA